MFHSRLVWLVQHPTVYSWGGTKAISRKTVSRVIPWCTRLYFSEGKDLRLLGYQVSYHCVPTVNLGYRSGIMTSATFRGCPLNTALCIRTQDQKLLFTLHFSSWANHMVCVFKKNTLVSWCIVWSYYFICDCKESSTKFGTPWLKTSLVQACLSLRWADQQHMRKIFLICLATTILETECIWVYKVLGIWDIGPHHAGKTTQY